jgi:hypothetical protein
VEETFQRGKGLAGLDEHQVRRHPSWGPLSHPGDARPGLSTAVTVVGHRAIAVPDGRYLEDMTS